MRGREWLCLLALGVAGGCSASTPPTPICPDFHSCVGNLVGTWSIQSFCASGNLTSGACTEVGLDDSMITAVGTLTFNADLTYTQTTTLSGTRIFRWPQSCLTVNGVSVSCDQIATGLMDAIGASFTDIGCVGKTDGCECHATEPPATTSQAGNYVVSGTTLTTIDTASKAATAYFYCADATTLRLKPRAAADTAGIIEANVVLTKQPPP